MTELELEVQDGEITITLPGSNYLATYHKPEDSLFLLAKRTPTRKDPRVALKIQSWKLANDKARELGWIV